MLIGFSSLRQAEPVSLWRRELLRQDEAANWSRRARWRTVKDM